MEPIISPWIFYLIEVLDTLKEVGWVCCIMGGIGFIVLFVIATKLNVDVETMRKIARWPIISIIVGIILTIFIPSEETMIKMLVASFIAPDNVELGVEGVKAIFEYIIETSATYSARIGG